MSQAQVPTKVAKYFGPDSKTRQGHPIITQVFTPGKGWKRTGFNKKVSVSWLKKLRREDGVTSVSLTCNGRTADFTVRELVEVPDEMTVEKQAQISAKVRRTVAW